MHSQLREESFLKAFWEREKAVFLDSKSSTADLARAVAAYDAANSLE